MISPHVLADLPLPCILQVYQPYAQGCQKSASQGGAPYRQLGRRKTGAPANAAQDKEGGCGLAGFVTATFCL